MANTEKIVNALDDANEILSKFVPLIPNIMGIIGLFISKPSVDPEVRRQAIASMRSTFTKVIVEADAWLEANGYDEHGNKKAE